MAELKTTPSELISLNEMDYVELFDGKNRAVYSAGQFIGKREKHPVNKITSGRIYKVQNALDRKVTDLACMGIWNIALGKSDIFDVARGLTNLKENRKVKKIDFDKIIVESKPIGIGKISCGQYNFRIDLYDHSVLVEPVKDTPVKGAYKARHPHIYQYSSYDNKYPNQLHVCLGSLCGSYSNALNRSDFTEAVDMIENMLNTSTWSGGIDMFPCTCDECGDMYFNEEHYSDLGIGICDGCK